MKTGYFFFICLTFATTIQGQNTYFPPVDNEEWERIEPADLGWCTDQVDSLLQFLDDNNTKAFMVLKDGRIAMEAYFDSFTSDSLWYWASAGKTLSAFLVGLAQDEGILSIEDPVQDYLGTGWTSMTDPQQEASIKIRHQLTMTSGLDDGVNDPNCLEPECLEYLTAPDSRWAYHNAPYRLVQDVVANASGLNFNQFTQTRLKNKIGMKGFWFNYIYFSRIRDMARFGLLLEQEGDWNGASILEDKSYHESMINTTQDLNLSYGYLTWLNGKSSHMLPALQFVFETPLVPNAPEDMYAALGKDDQKIHVVPSQDLVVVRLGEASDLPLFALSPFDNELWGKLNELMCTPTALEKQSQFNDITVFPNPVTDKLHFSNVASAIVQANLYNPLGQLMIQENNLDQAMDLSEFPAGIYYLQFFDGNGSLVNQQKVLLMK